MCWILDKVISHNVIARKSRKIVQERPRIAIFGRLPRKIEENKRLGEDSMDFSVQAISRIEYAIIPSLTK